MVTSLGPAREWKHNPDTSAYRVNNGPNEKAVTITDDLYSARNTLPKRIHGPVGTGTLKPDISNMVNGDCAGLALLRHQSRYMGVFRNGDSFTVNDVDNLTMGDNWVTTGTGTVGEGQDICSGTTWLAWSQILRLEEATRRSSITRQMAATSRRLDPCSL